MRTTLRIPIDRAEAGYVEGTKGLEPYLSRRRHKLMVATSKIILPYEPGYVANKEADNSVRKPTSGSGSASANLPNGNSRRQSCRSGLEPPQLAASSL